MSQESSDELSNGEQSDLTTERDLDSSKNEKDRGRLYWFFVNVRKKIRTFVRERFRLFLLLALVVISLLLYQRAEVQPAVLFIRKYFAFALLSVLLGLMFIWKIRRASPLGKILLGVVAAAISVGGYYFGPPLHTYVSLYLKYTELPREELSVLPVTAFERIHPLHSIHALAFEAMSETDAPMVPDFVKIGSDYKWTLAVEPAYSIPRAFGSVEKVFSIPGETPSPSFSKEYKIPVSFQAGEHLLFSRNSRTATIRAFGLLRYFSYEPADIKYMLDENGEWIQVVSLIRWSGIFFARPEFGGVQIIRQAEDSVLGSARRAFFGLGEWIPPEKIASHEGLVGSNLLPYEVSRFAANSFRFQNGFFAPMPGYHEGDIRIPDLAQDVNDQPFTAYFTMPEQTNGKLFHYFALEPFDPDKQGLNTSIFLPADGTDGAFVFRHLEKEGAQTGVSAISTKVMESRKNYDWNRNRPVEHRPYIRELAGKRRFFWLTTVVTMKEQGAGGGRFIAGTVPDVVLTDASYNTPIWVNPLKPESWISDVQEKMKDVWESEG